MLLCLNRSDGSSSGSARSWSETRAQTNLNSFASRHTGHRRRACVGAFFQDPDMQSPVTTSTATRFGNARRDSSLTGL